MEHLKLFAKRLNIPRLIRVCEEQQHWKELTFLYVAYDEHDNAAGVMMAHSPAAWEHVTFKDVIAKVSSADQYYKAMRFYLDEHPDLLADLMRALELRLDAARTVDMFRKEGKLPLIREYLANVQGGNLADVNEALNELLIEEEDFDGLRASITAHDNFDQVALASRLERHELLEFRRLAAFVYKRNLRWRKAVELAKADRLYKDAMETVAVSAAPELAEELLRWFVAQGERECFAAMLFTCYELLKPDVVMEVAWLHGLQGFAMPYMVQVVKEYTGKVDLLMSERRDAKDAEKGAVDAVRQQQAAANSYAMLMPLALPAPGYGMAPPGAGGGFTGQPY